MLNHESGVSPRYSCSYALIFVLSMLADPFECATNELTVSLTNLTNLYILSTSILTQLSIGTFVISALPSYFSAFFTKLDQNSKIVLAISVLFKLDSILDCMDFIWLTTSDVLNRMIFFSTSAGRPNVSGASYSLRPWICFITEVTLLSGGVKYGIKSILVSELLLNANLRYSSNTITSKSLSTLPP